MSRRNFEGSGIKLAKRMISIATSLRDCWVYRMKLLRRDLSKLLISKGFMVSASESVHLLIVNIRGRSDLGLSLMRLSMV